MMNNLVLVGIISGTHRLMGTVKLSTSFSYLNELVNKSVILKKDDKIKLLKVEDIRGLNNKKVLLDFFEIKNMEEAKELISYKVYVNKDLLENYEEEETVISYSVYNNGIKIGEVVDILETAAHDILVVEGEKEILIPYIDVFILNIDDDLKKIDVKLLEGMI